MIVLDASVLIALFDERDADHERAVAALLARSDQPLGCSSITLAEVLAGPARNGQLEVARTAVRAFGAREIGLGTDAAARLAALRAGTGLTLPDCCVLLAAQDERAGVLTFDDRLERAVETLGLGG